MALSPSLKALPNLEAALGCSYGTGSVALGFKVYRLGFRV